MMSPKRSFLNQLESSILSHNKFSKKYELSTLIYSNNNFYLYTIIDKSTKKKYFLEVLKSSHYGSENYIDQWETKEYCYIIKE
jgi:hypothetical protein